MTAFHPFELAAGAGLDLRANHFPTAVTAWAEQPVELPPKGAHLGFVHAGAAEIGTPAGRFRLTARW